jgi:hypothetical protein
MALPPEQSSGNLLSAKWLNDHRGETKKNTIRPGNGININRSELGTTVSTSGNLNDYNNFTGTRVTVLNKTGRDLEAYMVAGIEDATFTDEETVRDAASSGIQYILRRPEKGDDLSNWVLLLEDIDDDEAGHAFIRSDGVLARVRFEDDDKEDEDVQFAVFDFGDEEDESSEADQFFELKASKAGDIRILDRDEDEGAAKQESGNDFVWCIIRFCMHGGGVGTNEVPFRIGIDSGDSDIHTEDADDEEWDRDDEETHKQTQGGEEVDTDGVVILMQTRTEYESDGDEVLYGYQRRLTFDSAGKLVLVGPEVRYTIDDPEECDDDGGAEGQQLQGG